MKNLMKLKTLMTINAILAALYGAILLLIPSQFGKIFGLTANPGSLYVSRLLGAYLVSVGFLSWINRNRHDLHARRAILQSLMFMNVLGLLVTLLYQLTEVVNIFGWITVAMYTLVVLGFGYFVFVNPKAD